MRTLLLAPLLAVATGCGETGQPNVSYPLLGAGVATTGSSGAFTFSLDLAQLAIGPLYFCATEAASMDLCSAAESEFADVAVIDALSPVPQLLGQVTGSTGTIRSVTYDLGINWFTTQSAPVPAPAAPGGHSARFTGSATDGTRSFRFLAELDLVPSFQGTLTVQGTRVGPVAVHSERTELQLTADAAAWWARVDFEELAGLTGDPVVVPAGSRAHAALGLAITAQDPVRFSWQLDE